jgi:hypothetical protein
MPIISQFNGALHLMGCTSKIRDGAMRNVAHQCMLVTKLHGSVVSLIQSTVDNAQVLF